MKRNYHIILLTLLLSVASCSFTTNDKMEPDPGDDKDEILIELVNLVLSRYHYEPKDVNDDFSKMIYKDYLNGIDSRKRFLLKEDVEDFKIFKSQIDDQIKQGDISFFDLTYDRLVQRIEETRSFYKSILSEPFDFKKNETINSDFKEIDYAKTTEELRDRWKKQLKFSTLTTFYDLKEQEKTKAKNREDYEMKTDDELEEKAREETRKSLEQFFNLNDDLDRKDWFGIYINTIVEGFDPHSAYFSPRAKDRFDTQMSGSLEGIGARLQKKMDNIKIIEIISGGPAWRNDELEVGDIIKKVQQEDEEEAVSIVGMPISDAVDLIKGPKGSKVTLTVKKVDGTIEKIEIIRDIVEIEETFAKTSMVKKNQNNYGLINLPKFYFNDDKPNARTAATDIKKEVKRLKEQNMDGLIIDLRNNGGGSLGAVIKIAGFFIEEGPIVQVRDRRGKRNVYEDEDNSILYDGPLVIMVNELSASASEILAAAMQDYERAVILGSDQTYGKGTVQNLLNLNRMVNSSDYGDLGALKMTTQKFYRINGGSTQLKGVHSDVVVPDRYSYIDIGERDMQNPLPWDQIKPADYEKWNGYKNLSKTLRSSQKRMKRSEQINLIKESAKWVKKQRNADVYSLNYEDYAEEMQKNDSISKHFEKILNYKTDLTFTSLPYEEKRFKKDSALQEKRQNWHESLSKDVYVEEAIKVLADLHSDSEIEKVVKAKEN